MSDAPLHNHVAMVSGGLGDIGRAVAVELAGRGAAVAVCDLSEAPLAAGLLERLNARARERHGRSARYDRVDVTDAAAVGSWTRTVERTLGVPTLVIVNAASVTVAGVLEMTPQQWRREVEVNLNGAFHVAQAGARAMLGAGARGRVVFVGSWAADVPHPHVPAYSVAKAGLRMLCRCMALELAPRGITVNEVAPGYVDAGLSAQVFKERPGAREEAARRVPTGRMITPEEVAHQVAYLCGDAGPHVTGSVLLMDGGLSLGRSARIGEAGA